MIYKVGNNAADTTTGATDTTTVTDSDSSMVHTLSPVSDLKKCHLDGSRLFNLHNLSNAINIISKHSITCGAVVELIGEVQRNGLASRMLARCSKCNEEFLFSSCNKVILHNQDGKGRSTWAYNAAVVMEQMATGGGHGPLEEVLATRVETGSVPLTRMTH